jgi:hypothetical protein
VNKKQYPNPKGTGAGLPATVGFCDYFNAWWNPPVEFTPDKAPYKQVTVFPQRKNGLNAAQWVGYMYPSHNNPWRGEFVLLEKAVNRAKESVSIKYIICSTSHSNYSPHIANNLANGKLSQLWANHNPTELRVLDKLVKNEHVSVGKRTLKGIDSATKIMRQNLGLWQYHQEKSSVLKTQADRIGAALDYFDNAANIGATNPGTYEVIGFKKEWDDFIKKRTQAVIDKHTKFLDDYLKKLKDYQNKNNRLSKTQNDRITDLGNSIAIKRPWKNPF